jgi:hypothetical protein
LHRASQAGRNGATHFAPQSITSAREAVLPRLAALCPAIEHRQESHCFPR